MTYGKKKIKSELNAGIKITHNLVDNPILNDTVKSIEKLSKLNVGHQGTNFAATKEQYEKLLELMESIDDNLYQSVLNSLDKDKAQKFLSIIREFVTANNITQDDPRLSFNIRPKKKRTCIHNRKSLLTYVLLKIKTKTELWFISERQLQSKTMVYVTNQKGETEAHWNIVNDFSPYEEEINQGLQTEINRNNNSPFKRFSNQDFINDIYQTTGEL